MTAGDQNVVPAGADSDDFFSVLRLAKKFSSTLGFLPDTAFRDRAYAGRLLVVPAEDGEVRGYILFDLARSRVRIIQLCVSQTERPSAGRVLQSS